MSTLGQLAYAAIDFESAGAAPGETDYPVQIGIVRSRSLLDPQPECFTSYIACRHPVRWSASKVHGITAATLKDAPPFTSLWPEIKRLLGGAVVVGHNPATEIRFLRAFPGHGFTPWLDTLALARQAMPGLADYSLSSACNALGITPQVTALVPGKSWHDALYDAAGSLLLLRAIITGLDMQSATLRQIPFAVKD